MKANAIEESVDTIKLKLAWVCVEYITLPKSQGGVWGTSQQQSPKNLHRLSQKQPPPGTSQDWLFHWQQPGLSDACSQLVATSSFDKTK